MPGYIWNILLSQPFRKSFSPSIQESLIFKSGGNVLQDLHTAAQITKLCRRRSNSPLIYDTGNGAQPQTFKTKLMKYMAFFHLVVCCKNIAVLEFVGKSVFWHYTA